MDGAALGTATAVAELLTTAKNYYDDDKISSDSYKSPFYLIPYGYYNLGSATVSNLYSQGAIWTNRRVSYATSPSANRLVISSSFGISAGSATTNYARMVRCVAR